MCLEPTSRIALFKSFSSESIIELRASVPIAPLSIANKFSLNSLPASVEIESKSLDSSNSFALASSVNFDISSVFWSPLIDTPKLPIALVELNSFSFALSPSKKPNVELPLLVISVKYEAALESELKSGSFWSIVEKISENSLIPELVS